jgi:anti-sigma factor RsiW
LEAYVDGEVGEHESERVRTHLMTCSSCENEFEALTAESELYARYDRELQISPAAGAEFPRALPQNLGN